MTFFISLYLNADKVPSLNHSVSQRKTFDLTLFQLKAGVSSEGEISISVAILKVQHSIKKLICISQNMKHLKSKIEFNASVGGLKLIS